MTQNTQIIRPDEAAALAGWESPEGAEQAGALATVAREDSELKAAITSAKLFPRDEHAAYTRIVKACQRPGFAERARYAFPRGGSTVSGPSVNLARAMAQAWGNIRFGLRIVELTEDHVHVRGYALDLETNAYAEAEDRFARLVQRKVGKGRDAPTRWVAPDERDLRELVNRRGAIAVRNAILQLVPYDVTEDALRHAEETLRAAAKGELKQDRAAAIRRLALAFADLAITTAMLEDHLGHSLDAIDEQELADLRGVYASIRDGNTRRDEHFKIGAPRTSGTSDLNERLADADADVAGAATDESPDEPGEAEPADEPTGDEARKADLLGAIENASGDMNALGRLATSLSDDDRALIDVEFRMAMDEALQPKKPARRRGGS